MNDPILKLQNILGKDTVSEMEGMSKDDLETVIIQATQSMKEVKDELEKNQKYQEIKLSKSILESGKKEVDKRQKARIQFSLHLLENK